MRVDMKIVSAAAIMLLLLNLADAQQSRSRWDILLRGSVINRFLREVRDATVQVVPLDKRKEDAHQT